MARLLPVEQTKGDGRMAKLVGLISGFVPDCSLADFPLEPDMAISKQATFLSVWFAEKPTKPEARLSFQIACPKMSNLDRGEIVQHLVQYKRWLTKKAKNMKNGEKTSPAVLQVMKAMGLAPIASEPQPQPERMLKRKTHLPSDSLVAPEPAMAAIQKQDPQPENNKATIQKQDSQPGKAPATKSKILMLQGSSTKSKVESESSGSEEKEAFVVSTQEVSSTSSGIVTPQKLKPKNGKNGSYKRPASCMTPQKKPAMAPKTAKVTKPAKHVHMATHNTWVASCSFGWVKKGNFKEKGYIQARDGSESKPYCLVNVNLPKGDDQSKVLEACFAEAQKPSLDKAHMVNFKNNLLKQL